MNFSDFLLKKKIDETTFSKNEPGVFASWKSDFEQVHPNSFTLQKLNLINPIRRKYPLKGGMAETQPAVSGRADVPAKPVMKTKPKFK